MRNVLWLCRACTLALLAVTAGGCIGLTNTAADSSSGGTGADANSNTGNGGDATNGSQTNDGTTTGGTTTTGAGAQVDQVYCDGVIAIRDLPAAGQAGVFQISGAIGSFTGWIIGDDVSYDATFGRLTNTDQALEVTVVLLGARVRAARIITYSTGHSAMTLDDSSYWITNIADRAEALDWQTSDDVIVVQPSSGSEWWLVNIDRCEAIRATSAT